MPRTIPPTKNTAGLAKFLCSVKEPMAGSILASVPIGTLFSERLNAVSRIQVVKTNSLSNGELAMEKVDITPCVNFRRVAQYQVSILPRFEIDSGRLLEVKGHSTFSNFFSTHQLGRLTYHQNRFPSQGYLLTECANRVRLQPPEPQSLQ
jgi:hypothetical protein